MTEPVTFLDGRVQLFNADCREILPTLGKVDAVVTDPPYGLGDKWQGGRAEWSLSDGGSQTTWDACVSDALPDALRAAASAIVWGGNYYTLPPQRGWLVWDKINRGFSSGDVELAWSTIDQPTRAFNLARNIFTPVNAKGPPLPKERRAGRRSFNTSRPYVSETRVCFT